MAAIVRHIRCLQVRDEADRLKYRPRPNHSLWRLLDLISATLAGLGRPAAANPVEVMNNAATATTVTKTFQGIYATRLTRGIGVYILLIASLALACLASGL